MPSPDHCPVPPVIQLQRNLGAVEYKKWPMSAMATATHAYKIPRWGPALCPAQEQQAGEDDLREKGPEAAQTLLPPSQGPGTAGRGTGQACLTLWGSVSLGC